MKKFDKETGIWTVERAIQKQSKKHGDFILAGAIGMFFPIPERAADVGCGNGRYCKILSAFGWPLVHGFEGTPQVTSLGVYDKIFTLDLTKPLRIDPKYDFVLCLEVGEHIPRKHENVFLDNVCEFAKRDVVLSWGVPGQGGVGHVNCRPNEHIVEQMNLRGFKYNKKLAFKLRTHTCISWGKNTVMVFRRK